MSCDRYRDEIADAAAGDATAPELEIHLEECGACRRELRAQREGLALADEELSSLLASEASPDLSARIRRSVATDEERGWWPRGARPALAVAAALAIALGTAAIWRGASRPLGPESSQLTRLQPPQPDRGLRDHRPSPSPTPQQPTARRALAEVGVRGRTPSQPVSGPGESPGSAPPAAPSAGPREPEVLVPAGQEEALFRFAAELQRRAVTSDSLLVAEPFAPLNKTRPLYRVAIQSLTLDSTLDSDS